MDFPVRCSRIVPADTATYVGVWAERLVAGANVACRLWPGKVPTPRYTNISGYLLFGPDPSNPLARSLRQRRSRSAAAGRPTRCHFLVEPARVAAMEC